MFRGAHALQVDGDASQSGSQQRRSGINRSCAFRIGRDGHEEVQNLGSDCALLLRLDASAAIGICRRTGAGRVRHLDTRLLWVLIQVRGGAGLRSSRSWKQKTPQT